MLYLPQIFSGASMLSRGFICIYGPTGVGKTSLAESYASQIHGNIINMDMGQMYTPLSIGTAKPLWRSTPFQQHLFDCIEVPSSYDVARYRTTAQSLISKIHTQHQMPIFVGGSGFYCSSLFFKLTSAKVISSPADKELSWERLQQLDPLRAAQIHPHDEYRIKRALACIDAGELASAHKPLWEPIDAPQVVAFIQRDRDDLIARIEKRVDQMLEEGLIQEVAGLDAQWRSFVIEKKIIGYQEIIGFLEGKSTLAQARDQIIIRSRQYAKRQMSYGRMLLRQLSEHPTVHLLELNLSILTQQQAVEVLKEFVELLP